MKLLRIVLLSLALLALSFSFSHVHGYPDPGPSHGCAPASTGAGRPSPMCLPPNEDHVHEAYRPDSQPPVTQPESNF